MAFEYSEEQLTLKSTISRSLADVCDSVFLREFIDSKHSGEAVSSLFDELGLFEVFSDSEGPNLVEMSLIAQEVGYYLAPGDIVRSLFFGPYLSRLLPAYRDALSVLGVDIGSVNSGALKIGCGVKLNGAIDFVSEKSCKAVLFFDPELQALFLGSPVLQEGIAHSALDLTNKCFRFNVKDGAIKIEDSLALDGSRVLLAAEMSGIARRVVNMTVEYVKTRKQFGAAIGSFQAVQQQISDAYLRSEALLSLVEFSSWAFNSSVEQIGLASRSVLGFAFDNVPRIVETSIQLHGGIGFTWEYDLHLYLRRARQIKALYSLKRQDFEFILNSAHLNGA